MLGDPPSAGLAETPREVMVLEQPPVIPRCTPAVVHECPATHDREPRVGEALDEAAGGLEEILDTLDGTEPRHHRDDRSVRWKGELPPESLPALRRAPKARDVDAVGDHR